VSATQVGARPVLAVNGSPLRGQIEGHLRQVVVDTDASGPDSCRVVLDDPGRDVLRRSGIDLQATLTITAGRVGEETGDRVFDGVVYSLGFDFDDRGSFTTIVAYDRSYGLYNGLHTATYQNLTDSDLASQLADEVGLDVGRVAATDVVHDHLAQVNETHFEFLTRRAREVDRVLLVTGSELHFDEPTDAADGPDPGDYQSVDRLQLVPGGNLERLTARVTAAQQVSEVEVRGWDPQRKEAISATAPARSRAAELPDQPDKVATQFGSPRHVTVDLPLTTQAECDAVAAAQAERMASTFVHAEGVAHGDPRIVAGVAVSLGQTGGRFDGKLTVSRARHVWDRHGYHTSFVVSGGHDRSILGLVTGDGHRVRGQRVSGLVLGIVTNCSDDLGRVKLKFPWLSDDYESDWARVLQLGAGKDRGLVLLPEVNDEVLVGFEQGDTRRPYVLGGLYNGVDTAPFGLAVDKKNAGTVKTRGWRSRTGHELIFTDTEGKEKVELRTKDSAVSFVLDATDGSLKVETKGDLTLKIGGNASILPDKDFTVDATGSGTIKAKKGLSLESDGNVTVRGKQIALN
jgi:phage protein D